MANRRRRRNMDGDIEDEIREKIYLKWSGSQIHKHIEAKLKAEGKERFIPELRTVQRMIKDFSIIDKSGDWSIADSEPEDARLVLDVFADGIAQGYSSPNPPSKKFADWLIRVKRIAPDAPTPVVFFLSLLYSIAEEDSFIELKALDSYLAFTPWKEDRQYLRLYKRAVAKKWVPEVEMWSVLVDELFETGLIDPRFTGNADQVKEFEKDIYERSKRGTPTDSIEAIANLYEMHPEDAKDIIQKFKDGGTK